MKFVEHYLVAAALFVACDAVWLKFVANRFYKQQLGGLLLARPSFPPAVIFYLLYILGIVIFALDPALGQGSFGYALGHGALLGLLMYATYDLTNQATLKHWPAKLTVVDMTWGTFVTTVVTALTFVIFH